MTLILPSFLVILGFAILIKGADYLVDGAAALAKKFSISEIAIGLTVVAFGTSAPEMTVNIFAGIDGRPDLVFGNIIGSNIMNILLILGVAGLIYPLSTQHSTIWREIPLSLLAVLVVLGLCNDTFFGRQENILSRIDGFILLALFVAFLLYVYYLSSDGILEKPDIKDLSNAKTAIYTIAGLAGIILGAKIVVDNAVEIAKILGVSDKLIGFTVVAIGTSLPELVTSAVAAHKRKSDIAIGNIIGSNIFNIFLILGLTASITPLAFNLVINTDLLVLTAASIILFAAMFTGRKAKLDRPEAAFFLLTYIAYAVFLIMRK